MSQQQGPLAKRLLAEAVRLHEEEHGWLNEPGAEQAGRQTGAELETRIVARAQALSLAPTITQHLYHLNSGAKLLLIILLLLTLGAGLGSASAVLGPEGTVNILVVLGGLLGVQTVALLIWALLSTVRPQSLANATLGSVVVALGRSLGRRLLHGPQVLPAIGACNSLLVRGDVGRWVLSSISHGLWLSFSIGAWLGCVWMLSIHQYDFAWGTSLLSEQSFTSGLTRLAALPAALGFSVPDAQLIQLSRLGLPSAGGREQWSGLLLGCVLLYAIVPRGILLLICVQQSRSSLRKITLDLTQPGYVRLAAHLMPPPAHSLGVIDPAPARLHTQAPLPRPTRRPPANAAPTGTANHTSTALGGTNAGAASTSAGAANRTSTALGDTNAGAASTSAGAANRTSTALGGTNAGAVSTSAGTANHTSTALGGTNAGAVSTSAGTANRTSTALGGTNAGAASTSAGAANRTSTALGDTNNANPAPNDTSTRSTRSLADAARTATASAKHTLSEVLTDLTHDLSQVHSELQAAANAPVITEPVLLFALELDDTKYQLPELPALNTRSLGHIGDRQQRREAIAMLEHFPTQAAALVVLCSYTRTPDRGIAAALRQLGEATHAPLYLWLIEEERLRARGADVALRRHHWRVLAEQLAVPLLEGSALTISTRLRQELV